MSAPETTAGPAGGAPGLLAPLREMLTPALAMLLLFQVLSGLLVSPLFSLFPVYVEKHLGQSPVFTGNIRGAFVIMGAVAAVAGGAICDTLGRKPSYLLAGTGVVASGLLFLVREPALLYLLAFYAGLMFGLGAVAGQTYLMETARRSSLALATACFFMTGTLGNALGSAAAGWIAQAAPNGYALLGVLMTAGHAAVLLAVWWLLPPIPRPDRPRTLEGLAGGYAELLRRPPVWFLLGLRFLPTVYWGSVTLLMPLLLFRLTGSEEPPGYYTSASLLLAAACQMAAGRWVDRIGPRAPVVTAVTLVGVATLGQAFFIESPAGLVAFGLLGSGAAWALSITMTTLVQRLTAEETRAKLLGITHVAWSGGFLAGTLAGGYYGREASWTAGAFFICAGCAAGAVLCALAVVSAASRSGDAE